MSAAKPPILLVEDDLNDVFLTTTALKEADLGHPVVTAEDGDRAWRLLDDEGLEPALVLLDLNLPKVSGLEVLERIRAHKKLSRLRVLVLTSSDEPRDRARARELRADGYLLKPMSLDQYDELASVVRGLLRP